MKPPAVVSFPLWQPLLLVFVVAPVLIVFGLLSLAVGMVAFRYA